MNKIKMLMSGTNFVTLRRRFFYWYFQLNGKKETWKLGTVGALFKSGANVNVHISSILCSCK